MNRDRSYHRKQRMRAIHRKETILRQLGGEEYVLAWEHGAAGTAVQGEDSLLLLDVPQKVV